MHGERKKPTTAAVTIIMIIFMCNLQQFTRRLEEKLHLASFAWTTLLTSTLLAECSSGCARERASERARGLQTVHPSSPVVPLVATNMCESILRPAVMFPSRCYQTAYIWPAAKATTFTSSQRGRGFS